MNIRPMTQDDIPQAKDLAHYAFAEVSFFNWFFDECIEPKQLIGNFDVNGKLNAMLCLSPYTLRIHGQDFTAAYITSVATSPDSRATGHVRPLFSFVFDYLKNNGVAIALIKAIESELYAPFGFAFCYSHLRYQFPIQKLSKFTKKDGAELVYATDPQRNIEQFAVVYDSLFSRHNAMSVRTTKHWRNLLTTHSMDNGHVMFLESCGKCIGYMLYYIRGDTLDIFEMAALDSQAESHLLNAVYQHRTQVKKFFWRTPSSDTAYLKMNITQYANAKYPHHAPFMMARIIDIAQVTEHLISRSQFPSIKFQVVDDFFKTNNITRFPESHNSFQDNHCDFSVDIGTFTQMFMGSYTIDQLVYNQQIKLHTPEISSTLRLVFPTNSTYINEEF